MLAEPLTLVSPTTTQHPTPASAPLKRCAIIGTAQSWKACPWQDATLEVWGLNDAYLIGVPRANRWYDLHPFHQMQFRPATPQARHVDAATVPTGSYLRPAGHLDWLRTRPIPVYLAQGRADYPTSQSFPRDAIIEFFRPYWPLRRTRAGTIEPGPTWVVSTPAWMLMHAILEGYQEIHAYGIHLNTQWEYQKQAPNWSFLLGFARGRGIQIVLPAATPICRDAYLYAFDPKSDLPLQVIMNEIASLKARGLALRQRLTALPWHARRQRAELQSRLTALEIAVADTRQALGRAQAQMVR